MNLRIVGVNKMDSPKIIWMFERNNIWVLILIYFNKILISWAQIIDKNSL